ncbi:hypothetical protein ACFVW8_05530 [Streptomyces sp. NPDC058221]|uniref:hypothetical protein n=1 Tax=Streptomyces sp. NPDC058221 TaxID=3346388 RepID=UPI0036E48E9D
MTDMFGILRRAVTPGRKGVRPGSPTTAPERRQHNLFDAAATFVAASVEDDQDRMDEASGWVSPEALSFGVGELAQRAVLALARERGESPEGVARTLLGLADE